ncbi:hypothetical protein QP519_05935 [Weeksella virosa]|uniref:hypothetical protein n=1 Tax=Weeksella virosa TaxID=1014 RepID=UPI0025521267|nr:hypothetical protein [Weeksella virosa]MDK7375077.1 hypothetical protein [Weeksella virosa]
MEIPEGYKNGDIFSITSVDAFRDLPWETAATYGGTSFKIIDLENGIIEVQDQKYHYNMHKNNSVKNILRNCKSPKNSDSLKYYKNL